MIPDNSKLSNLFNLVQVTTLNFPFTAGDHEQLKTAFHGLKHVGQSFFSFPSRRPSDGAKFFSVKLR
jgi:hypothetical protein